MANVSLSAAAIEKILSERDKYMRAIDRRGLIPVLHHHLAGYYTLKDGSAADDGPGFALFFHERHEIDDKKHLVIDLPQHGAVAVAPGDFFRAGTHSIDWNGEKFTHTRA